MPHVPDRLAEARRALLQRLLPDGVPTLWCPLLTHYRDDGSIDAERMRSHLDALHGSVGGLLVPGSTGDGWQLSDDQTRALLELLVPEARARGMALLIGVLKTHTADALSTLRGTMAWLRALTGAASDEQALRQAGVCGFTVCPPQGAELSQSTIRDALERVLATGLPVSLYQLPQVTHNEMSADTVAWLAQRHPNFLLFKDTSGEDRVAEAGVRDVFMVRGAEGAYHRHLGRYDGFLLSTANCFGPQLSRLIDAARAGDTALAQSLSDQLDAAVPPVFAAAAELPFGNAFTNANKAFDHFMAFGPGAVGVTPPRVHSGQRLPVPLIALAGDALGRAGLMPLRGYVD